MAIKKDLLKVTADEKQKWHLVFLILSWYYPDYAAAARVSSIAIECW